MARRDVHPLRGADDRYVLDVQAEVLSQRATRAVVPLLPAAAAPKPIGELNPAFDIGGRPYYRLSMKVDTSRFGSVSDSRGEAWSRRDSRFSAIGYYVLVTQAIATVPARALKPAVASLAEHRDRVTRALDLLLVGF